MQKISIIIPTRNEADNILALLTPLQAARNHGHEIILVDGGSTDKTVENASTLVDLCISSKAGRATQMNLGAKHSKHTILLFLHADTQLPYGFDGIIQNAIANKKKWGRFDIQLDNPKFIYRIIEWSINIRSRLSGVATGDQAIFIDRDFFHDNGGFAEIKLMEDIALSITLMRKHRPVCIRQKALTSSRRWETYGVLRTILLMWRLRAAYYLGVAPDTLEKQYNSRSESPE